MPRLTIVNASAVVVGDVFTPNLLTPTTFEKFFRGEQPRGITTNVVTQLEYPKSEVVATLEERKFQVVKRTPKQADLKLLTELITFFTRANPLVKLTAAGLNYAAFVRYSSGGRGSEEQFINRYVGHDELERLVDAQPESVALKSVYQIGENLCRLTLSSDAILDSTSGVFIDLNVHRDLGAKNARPQLTRHLGTFPKWWKYLLNISNKLSKQI